MSRATGGLLSHALPRRCETLTIRSTNWPELHGFSWWSETFSDGSSVMSVPDAPELRVIFHNVLNGPLGPKLQDRPVLR